MMQFVEDNIQKCKRKVSKMISLFSVPLPDSSVAMSRTRYFHYPDISMWTHTVFTLDPEKAEPLDQINFDEGQGELYDSRIVQYLNSMLIFTFSDYQIAVLQVEVESSEKAIETRMSSLKRSARYFAVANYRNKFVYLSGGSG